MDKLIADIPHARKVIRNLNLSGPVWIMNEQKTVPHFESKGRAVTVGKYS